MARSGPSSSGDCTRGFCWSCTDWRHRGSSGFEPADRDRSRVLDRPANRRHVPSGLSRLVDLPRRFARASRRHAGGDRPAAGDSGRGLSGPRGPRRSSRSCWSSSCSTPPTISTSSAVRRGMSEASSTPRVSTPSCSSASSAASSSSIFSFRRQHEFLFVILIVLLIVFIILILILMIPVATEADTAHA